MGTKYEFDPETGKLKKLDLEGDRQSIIREAEIYLGRLADYSFTAVIVNRGLSIQDNRLYTKDAYGGSKRVTLTNVPLKDIKALFDLIRETEQSVKGIVNQVLTKLSADVMELAFSEEGGIQDKGKLIKKLEKKKKDDLYHYFVTGLNLETGNCLRIMDLSIDLENLQLSLHYNKDYSGGNSVSYHALGNIFESNVLNFLMNFDKAIVLLREVIDQIKGKEKEENLNE